MRYPEWNKAKSAGDSVKGCSLYQHGKCVVDYVKNFDSSHCDCIQACSERIPEGQLTQYGYDSCTMIRDGHVQNTRYTWANFLKLKRYCPMYFRVYFSKIASKNFFDHMSRVKNQFFSEISRKKTFKLPAGPSWTLKLS